MSGRRDHQIDVRVTPDMGGSERWTHDWEADVHTYRGPVTFELSSRTQGLAMTRQLPISMWTRLTLDFSEFHPFRTPPTPEASQEVNGPIVGERVSTHSSRVPRVRSREGSVNQSSSDTIPSYHPLPLHLVGTYSSPIVQGRARGSREPGQRKVEGIDDEEEEEEEAAKSSSEEDPEEDPMERDPSP